MADRMTTEEIVALLDLLRSYAGDDHSIAPVRVHEAVSVFDELLELRAEVERLTRIVEERDAPPAEVARVLAALGKVDR